MLAATTVAIAVVVIAVALLAVGIAAVREVRTIRLRRQRALAAGPRQALLAFVADNGEEGADGLVAIPQDAWHAAEPAAVALLGKVKGDAHRGLVAVFRRRGAVSPARRDLRAHGVVRRARAAQVLGDLEAREAVADLCTLLEDQHADVRTVAVRALGRIAEPGAAWGLIASLDRANPTPSLLVTDALIQLGPQAEVTLSAALDHPRARVRAVCLDALGPLGATGTVDRVARVLRDDASLDVRTAAARTLGKLGVRSAVAPLVDALAVRQPGPLRAAAARALGDLGATTAVPTLAELLGDPQYRVAHEAAHALRRIGDLGLEALRRAAEESPAAASHAREALALAAIETPTTAAAETQTLVATG